jgi:FkbM family methyltransferase
MYNPDWLRYCKRVVRAGLGTDHLLESEVRIQKKYVGSAYGGWMIATAPLQYIASPVVLSFGLGDDISFDEELIRHYQGQVYGFDPTPASLRWIANRGVPAGMQVHPIGIAAFDGEQAFYLPQRETRGNFSSRQSTGTTTICQVRRYTTILSMLGLQNVDILKLDVEGAEYDVINDLVTSPLLPTQLLVEFHHRLHNIQVAETRRSVQTIRRAGFSLFAVSPGGQELSFIRK